MSGTITQATPPNLISKPNVSFDKGLFESAVWNKGYDVIWERALECPCHAKNAAPLTNCQNCLGTGYFFVNPIGTKAIITSINGSTKYQAWSEERLGTVSVTFREDENLSIGKIGFMDRITLKNSSLVRNVSVFSEVVRVRELSGDPFLFLTYKPINILSVFAFDAIDKQLIRLTEDDYSISDDNGYIIDIDYSFQDNFNGYLSINYEHEVQYHIIDMPHDIRNSYLKDSSGRDTQLLLPPNAIARRANLVFEKQNRNATDLINNSWLEVLNRVLLASEGTIKISDGTVKISDLTI